MNIIEPLLKQIFVMFILIGIGFILYKTGIISSQGSKDISRALLYLVVPVVIIKNFMIERTSENIVLLVYAIILTIISCLVAIVVARMLFSKGNDVSCFCSTFANTGFIGLPIVEALFGEIAVFYISVMIVMISVLEWTYGIYILCKDKNAIKFKMIITNPIVIAVTIGITLFFGQIKIPLVLNNVLDNISYLNTPLAMITSGVYLAQSNILTMLKKTNVYKVVIVRLIIIPLITMFVIKYIPLGNFDLKIIILIGSACPVGSNAAIFANVYNKDYISAVEQVCMTTLFSIISLPVLVSLASIVLL